MSNELFNQFGLQPAIPPTHLSIKSRSRSLVVRVVAECGGGEIIRGCDDAGQIGLGLERVGRRNGAGWRNLFRHNLHTRARAPHLWDIRSGTALTAPQPRA